jgi:hypothetical protein
MFNFKGYLLKAQFLFVAGCVGGTLSYAFLWALEEWNVLEYWHVQLTATWQIPELCEKVVFSGLWAFIFFLPLLHDQRIFRALVFSLAPTVFNLVQMSSTGFDLGTAVTVGLMNLAWSLVTLWWLKMWTTSA